jgi:hypothetical protein
VQDRRLTREEAAQPARLAHAGEQVEEVAGVGRRERSAKAPDERAPRTRGQVHMTREPRQIPGGGALADEVRLRLDAERNRPGRPPTRRERSLLLQVTAVHIRVGDGEGTKHRVHAGRPARGRAADPDEELVRGVTVGDDEHLAQEHVEARSRPGSAAKAAEKLDGDRELQRRRARELRARVPGCARTGAEILDEDGARPAKAARQPADRARERGILPARKRR